jgi:ankyrin repeat protein
MRDFENNQENKQKSKYADLYKLYPRAEGKFSDNFLDFLAEKKGKDAVNSVLLLSGHYDELPLSSIIVPHNATYELVKFLIEEGEDVNRVERGIKRTPIFTATYYGMEEVVELLLSKGANINHIDANGHTPLYYRIKDCDEKMVKFLLNKGADPLAGDNPLSHAEKDVTIYKHILDSGKVDVNLPIGYNQDTALHIAIKDKNYNLIKLLLQRGADLNKPNKEGKTPLHYADELGYEYLEKSKNLIVETYNKHIEIIENLEKLKLAKDLYIGETLNTIKYVMEHEGLLRYVINEALEATQEDKLYTIKVSDPENDNYYSMFNTKSSIAAKLHDNADFYLNMLDSINVNKGLIDFLSNFSDQEIYLSLYLSMILSNNIEECKFLSESIISAVQKSLNDAISQHNPQALNGLASCIIQDITSLDLPIEDNVKAYLAHSISKLACTMLGSNEALEGLSNIAKDNQLVIQELASLIVNELLERGDISEILYGTSHDVTLDTLDRAIANNLLNIVEHIGSNSLEHIFPNGEEEVAAAISSNLDKLDVLFDHLVNLNANYYSSLYEKSVHFASTKAYLQFYDELTQEQSFNKSKVEKVEPEGKEEVLDDYSNSGLTEVYTNSLGCRELEFDQ